MKVAFIDSGLGALPTAASFNRLRPDVDIVLSLDPDKMPWGPLPDDVVAQRALLCAQAALDAGATTLVMACNTASVLALDLLRDKYEPKVLVVGTVPAIKPAAATGQPFAVWATQGTTGSPYQRRLIDEFASGIPVTQIACPGLAEAIEAGDVAAINAVVKDAVRRTPQDSSAVVLGCTQYPLVADTIRASLPKSCSLFDSSDAVARQALRRIGLETTPISDRSGSLTVLLSGRIAELPEVALRYASGSQLALLRRNNDLGRPAAQDMPVTARKRRG